MTAGRREPSAWLAAQHRACTLCPRRCGVNRRDGARGWCGAGAVPAWYRAFVHWGEEPELAPSLTLYLTGCNLACAFCHTARERAQAVGQALTAAALREITAQGLRQGARNLNLLGGEPLVNLPGLLPLLADPALRQGLPLVWNTNLYATSEALADLGGLPDIYLVDLKFGPGSCGARLAAAADYWPVVTARLAELHQRHPDRIRLRHLVMPGHLECCTRPALEWVAAHLPGVPVHVMTEYLPAAPAGADAGLGRFLTHAEAAAALELAAGLGLRPGPSPSPSARAPRSGGGSAPATPRHRPPDADEGLVEVVISPAGGLYLRHPTRSALHLARRACLPPTDTTKDMV